MSAISLSGMPNRSATPCRKAPLPEEHCEFRRKSLTVAVFQDHDLDVNAAHVANAIGIGEVVQSRGGVRNRFHHAAIRAQNALQQILAVARDSETQNFAVADGIAKLAEQTLRVFDGIALAQRVAGKEQFTVGSEAHGLRRSRAKIAAHHDVIQFFLFDCDVRPLSLSTLCSRLKWRPSWNTGR